MIKLSNRLLKICELIDSNYKVTDIASDHGYVPIYLIKNKIAKSVIITDININSINSIKNNCASFLTEEENKNIDIRLGDGLKVLKYDESDVIIISGIGYDLLKYILSNINDYNFKYLILSPQSKLYEFRKFIHEKYLHISNEEIIVEDNIYYFIFKIDNNYNNDKYEEYEYLYSKLLIDNKNELLKKYIIKKIEIYKKILNKIDDNNKKYFDIKKLLDLSYLALQKME